MKNFEAISALAGAGKTYRLTSRFIALLARKAKAESILAITFTRKAAGEIFDRIIGRLAQAILDPNERTKLECDLKEMLQEPSYHLTEADLQEWLHGVVRAIPRLRIGTIDSLFVHMVQAFAFELGLPARMEIIDGAALAIAQEQAMDHAFQSTRSDPTLLEWLKDVVWKISQGERKVLRAELLEKIASCHELYLEKPDERQWGDLGTIWCGPTWWNSSARKVSAENLRANLLDLVLPANADSSYREAWDKAIQHLAGGQWDRADSSKLLDFLLENWTPPPQGPLLFSYRKKEYTIPAEAWPMLQRITAQSFAACVQRLCDSARGAYRLLNAYEQAYAQLVRQAGRLSFHDVQFVLRKAAESDVHLDIDYRLDGIFEHWMVDEFQDTSRQQWAVLENVVNEVFQSGSANRSFFYVGDPKQAIYGWRGGDSTLFDEIREKYRTLFTDKPTILDTCWRSSPVILETVNTLFDPARLKTVLPDFAEEVERWQKNWSVHQPAKINQDLAGYVEVREIPKTSLSADNEEPPLIVELCKLVAHLHRNGVRSIAVLVRLNRFGDKVADALCTAGISVLREVNPQLCDNAVISTLLSMLEFADHPGNEFYFQHIQHSGLLSVLERVFQLPGGNWERTSARQQLARCLSERAAEVGVAGLLSEVIRAAFEHTNGWPKDDFISTRLRQLLLAATDYDRLGPGSPSDFAEQAFTLEVKDPVVTEGVVVMTVHKAKGLEFDAVILPDLAQQRRGMTYVAAGTLHLFEIPENEAQKLGTRPGWILPMPDRQTAMLDPVLRRFRNAVEHKRFYEELCLLYVATTRARQALYFLIPESTPNKKGTKCEDATEMACCLKDPYPADLVRSAFRQSPHATPKSVGGATPNGARILFSNGDAEWFSKPHPLAAKAPIEHAALSFAPVVKKRTEVRKRLLAGTPSGTEEGAWTSPEKFFDVSTCQAAQRGKLVHELFQQIGWFEPDVGARIANAFRQKMRRLNAAVVEEAVQEFLAALSTPGILDCLKRPTEQAEVWTEQAFELAEDNRWITGRIDRVVIARDARGVITRATVVDFKTDRIVSDEEIQNRVMLYREQMRWYVRAISKLTGLPAERVQTYLIFTYPRRVIVVE